MAVDLDNTIYGGRLSEAVSTLIANGEGMKWGDHVATETSVAGAPVELRYVKHNDAGLVDSVDKITDTVLAASTAQTTFDNRQLTTKELMYTQTLPLTQFQGDHIVFQPNGQSIDLTASPAVDKAVRESIFSYIQTRLNLLHGAGVSGTNQYDGFETKITGDAECTEVGTGAVITSANVIERFETLADALPPRLMSKDNLQGFCSYSAAKLYVRQMVRTQNQEPINKVTGALEVLLGNGKVVEFYPKEGLSANFAFITPAGTDKNTTNLYQGVWMNQDETGLAVYKSQPADKVINFVFRGWFGVEYVTGENIYYIDGV